MSSRGGWSWTLRTKNLLADARPQESYSENLQRGAAIAHRQRQPDGIEMRNLRRDAGAKTGRVG